MVALTSLNHFLLQPIERLQVYSAVLRYLKPRAKARAIAVDASMRVSSMSSVAPSMVDRGGSTVARAMDRPPLKLDGSSRGPSLTANVLIPSQRGGWWTRFLSKLRQKNNFAIVHRPSRKHSISPTFTVSRHCELDAFSSTTPWIPSTQRRGCNDCLYQDATKLPAILYRAGAVGTLVHCAVWVLLILTVWRVAIARDAVRDSERSFQELYLAQLHGESNHKGENDEETRERRRKIKITDRSRGAPPANVKKNQIAPSSTASETESQQELKHLVVFQELNSVLSDVCRVWPTENSNIGLGGFWSSLLFTAIAIASSFLYELLSWLIDVSPSNATVLSYYVCVSTGHSGSCSPSSRSSVSHARFQRSVKCGTWKRSTSRRSHTACTTTW